MVVNSAQPGEGGWQTHSPFHSINLPPRAKLWCTLQLRRQIHDRFLLYPFLLCGANHHVLRNYKYTTSKIFTTPRVNLLENLLFFNALKIFRYRQQSQLYPLYTVKNVNERSLSLVGYAGMSLGCPDVFPARKSIISDITVLPAGDGDNLLN